LGITLTDIGDRHKAYEALFDNVTVTDDRKRWMDRSKRRFFSANGHRRPLKIKNVYFFALADTRDRDKFNLLVLSFFPLLPLLFPSRILLLTQVHFNMR